MKAFESTADKTRLLAVCNHIFAIAAVWYAIHNDLMGWLIASGVMFIFVAIFSTNIALHRFLSHRSFKTGPLRTKFLKYVSIISAFGSPVVWCAMHRYHHKHSGSKLDNQSPKNIGYFKAYLSLYSPATIPPTMVKDILVDKDCRFIHKNYHLLLAAYVASLVVISPLAPFFLFCIPAALCYQAAGGFTVIPHSKKFGYKVLPSINEDDAVNSPLASLISIGEGWHNYHHTRPGDYRHGHNWWELDPPAYIIRLLFLKRR